MARRSMRTYSLPLAASSAPTVSSRNKSFVTNAFTLPHVVDGDAQVDGFVDQYELPARKLIHEARTVQILIADLDIKIVYHPLAVRLGALRPEADFELVVEAPLK